MRSAPRPSIHGHEQMALKATIYKVDLQIANMDRNYYAEHNLTLAQHPSETDERMMARVLMYALNAQEGIAFTRGLSETDEPEIWVKDLTGQITLWIDIGQPDEARLRKACGRAGQVIVLCHSSSCEHPEQADAPDQSERAATAGGRQPGPGRAGAAHHAPAMPGAGRRGVDQHRRRARVGQAESAQGGGAITTAAFRCMHRCSAG